MNVKRNIMPLFRFLVVFIFLSLVFSCTKKDDDVSPSASPNSSTSSKVKDAEYYFISTIDGEVFAVGQLIEGYGNGMSGSRTGGFVDSTTEIIQSSYFGHVLDTSKPSFTIGLITLFQGYSSNLSIDDKSQAIQTGIYSYGKPMDTKQTVEGGVVEFYQNGVNWTTYSGSAIQNGSNFEITEVIDNPNQSLSKRIFKVKFNCTLYDGKGNSMKLSGGEAKGQIVIPWS